MLRAASCKLLFLSVVVEEDVVLAVVVEAVLAVVVEEAVLAVVVEEAVLAVVVEEEVLASCLLLLLPGADSCCASRLD